MKRVILFSLMALMTVSAFGRKHVENATVVADTIFYAENMSNVASADQASYYRLLMTTGTGITIAIQSSMVRLLPTIRMVRRSGMASMSMVSARATSLFSSVKAV